jgi:hypothetical protein
MVNKEPIEAKYCTRLILDLDSRVIRDNLEFLERNAEVEETSEERERRTKEGEKERESRKKKRIV